VCEELVTVFPEQLPSVDLLVEEVIRVAQATANNRCAGDRLAALLPYTPPSAQSRCRFTCSTTHVRSSMLQDMTAGRPTEVDFLNGYVIKQAGARGMKVSMSWDMHCMMQICKLEHECFVFLDLCNCLPCLNVCRYLSTQPCTS
jgi:ketopantoate reductase